MEVPVFELVGAVVVAGVVQAIKQAIDLPSKFAPLLSIAIGVLAGLVWASTGDATATVGGISGLIAGLTASGLYSGQKAVRGQ